MRASLLEARAECEHERGAVRSCPGDFQPRHRTDLCMKARPDAVGAVEICEVEVAAIVHDLSRVEKQRHVNESAGCPSVLARQEHAMPASKSPRGVTAKRPAAA